MKIRKMENNGSTQARLTKMLAEASEAYYNGSPALMTDTEFDRLYEQLAEAERISGFAYDISPTVHVGTTIVTELEKMRHEVPALSLDKVKYVNREKMIRWLGSQDGVLSWKLDGMTIVATYDNGKLTQAVTRGDGEEGGIVTHNAVSFHGLPVTIPYKGHMVIRGEALMSYEEFIRINAEADGLYENPRNLAAATVQMFDGKESAKRKIDFYAFKLVTPGTAGNAEPSLNTETGRFRYMESCGIRVVPYELVDTGNILDKIENWKAKMPGNTFPTDGLVVSYNDQVYADSLGSTNKYPRGSIALKWEDESKETTVSNVRFSVGRTGRITPVAVFNPAVRLGAGSNISRASLHNISIMRNMPETGNPGHTLPVKIGSKAEVALAQMIIPSVISIKGGEKDVDIPSVCPICGEPTSLVKNGGVEMLYCRNIKCAARTRSALESAFSKSGLYAKGIGPSTIEDLQQTQLVSIYPAELFSLEKRYDRKLPAELKGMEGWGEKSWTNLLDAVNAARKATLRRFLYSLGVPMLGNDLSKKLSDYWNGDIEGFFKFYENPDTATIQELDGVGEVKANFLAQWCEKTKKDSNDDYMLHALARELEFEVPAAGSGAGTLSGLTFVITGSVYQYKNRDEFKDSVEARGGKVAGSVSKKTDFLVNNDSESNSGKNKKAKELGIPVITEQEFTERFGR